MPSVFTVEVVQKGINSCIKIDKHDKTEWRTYKTPLAAQEAAKAMEAGLVDSSTITLSEFWDRFMEYHALPNLAPSSVQRYKATFTTDIEAILGDKPLATITASDVAGLMRYLKSNGRKSSRIQNVRNLLSSIMGQAVKWKYIDSNPVDQLDW